MYLHPSVSIVVMMKRSPGTSITSDWSITVNCKFYNGIAHMLTMVDNHTTGQRQDDDEEEETTSTLYSVVVKHTIGIELVSPSTSTTKWHRQKAILQLTQPLCIVILNYIRALIGTSISTG